MHRGHMSAEVSGHLVARGARALEAEVVRAMDLDVGHVSSQRCAGPMSRSGSQVAISGKKQSTTIARNMHST